MKGHVETPASVAEEMVKLLFDGDPPTRSDRILYPGSGTGPFPAAVEQVCADNEWPLPSGTGIELDPDRIAEAQQRDLTHVTFNEADFLTAAIQEMEPFEYIIGNPPYVPIERLSDAEKSQYRSRFDTATGRFDLYLLFFEQALQLLAEQGRLAFVSPEKFEYVETAAPLRRKLAHDGIHIERLIHLDENAFSGHVTYPCITVIQNGSSGHTEITLRDGTTHTATLPDTGDSWAQVVRNFDPTAMQTGATLGDITERISPGVATGADGVFVSTADELPPQLAPDWTYPTVSGTQLEANDGPYGPDVFICPYQDDGRLPDADELGPFGEWAQLHRDRLEDRSCVEKQGKRWYAWHETPPMTDLLQPKIVFPDIADEPKFWHEPKGTVVPRHSVYYMIPADNVPVADLLDYLNSAQVREWLDANCQRAANGFLRLQSRVLSELPVPAEWSDTYQSTLHSA